ncbi:MAG TPA: CHRD domain-containing protein [Caulobacteraceae bacterium]|nr:CHRD domain-containing protein [Caulobacteraceae bacterium]
MKGLWTGAAVALLVFAATAARAATLHFAAPLKGGDEVPPTDSKGTGKVEATLDTATKKLSYTVTYSGLTGPATMAHFHGPALAGANAGVEVPVPTSALANPMKGSATLTDSQVSDFEAGKIYFNIHTAAHPGGEVRGQLAEVK